MAESTADRTSEALERLVEAHDTVGSPLRRLLRPAVTEARLVALENDLGFELSATIRTVYLWADGADAMHQGMRVPLGQPEHYLATLDRCIAERAKVTAWLRRNGMEHLWSDRWVPILIAGSPSRANVSCLRGRESRETVVGAAGLGRAYRLPDLATVIEQHVTHIRSGRWEWRPDDMNGPWYDTKYPPFNDTHITGKDWLPPEALIPGSDGDDDIAILPTS